MCQKYRLFSPTNTKPRPLNLFINGFSLTGRNITTLRANQADIKELSLDVGYVLETGPNDMLHALWNFLNLEQLRLENGLSLKLNHLYTLFYRRPVADSLCSILFGFVVLSRPAVALFARALRTNNTVKEFQLSSMASTACNITSPLLERTSVEIWNLDAYDMRDVEAYAFFKRSKSRLCELKLLKVCSLDSLSALKLRVHLGQLGRFLISMYWYFRTSSEKAGPVAYFEAILGENFKKET